MNLLDRLWELVRSSFNSAMEEDPEKILEATIEELETELISLRQSLAQAIALSKRTERQIKHNQAYAQQWYQRAQLAIKQQQEDLARESLFRRQSNLAQIESLQLQLPAQLETIKQLKKQLRILETKVAEMKLKKDLYIARYRSAAMQQKLATLGDIEALEKIEQKLLEQEAQAELSSDPLEAQFNKLQANIQVEAELTKIKTESSSEIERLKSEIDKI